MLLLLCSRPPQKPSNISGIMGRIATGDSSPIKPSACKRLCGWVHIRMCLSVSHLSLSHTHTPSIIYHKEWLVHRNINLQTMWLMHLEQIPWCKYITASLVRCPPWHTLSCYRLAFRNLDNFNKCGLRHSEIPSHNADWGNSRSWTPHLLTVAKVEAHCHRYLQPYATSSY